MLTTENWPTKPLSVASLHLDSKNPRLGREVTSQAPREIIQYLFDHDKAFEVAESITSRGFFPNEPLLAIEEDGRYVVVEGNRRLAALKALKEPGILEGHYGKKVERLSRQITNPSRITTIPVTIAPSRRATDRLLAGRHIGSPVLAWQAENRASFILDKLAEGYTNDQLRDELGFTLVDIQNARQTRAIADMARSLDLPEEVKAKLDNPRANVFTTLERVFDSSVGRKFLMVEPNPDHGLKGTTTKGEFTKGFRRLVMDVALGKESSRSLNSNDNIREYFIKRCNKEDLPQKKRGSFLPSELIQGKSVASPSSGSISRKLQEKSKKESITVIPKDLKVRHGDDRLIDIRRELTKLRRKEYPNAGAVMLRVFLELAVKHYLNRIGELPKITERIKRLGKLPPTGLKMGQLIPEILRIAEKNLSKNDYVFVEKALKYNPSAPFSINDLNAFIHSRDLPSERDIHQFWIRTEPLFRMMLEKD